MFWLLYGLLLIGGAWGLCITVKVLSGFTNGMKSE